MMLLGQKIGPFVIEKELGSGAMGTVYRAQYVDTPEEGTSGSVRKKIVALKIISIAMAGNETALARFEREHRILQQLKHPNIVRLFAFGRFRGTPFFAMEYIEGESLDRKQARNLKFSWEEVVEIGMQVCAALQHAHEKGIIHRDLKPSNLMVLDIGTVKLTDFGIAKDVDVTALTGANSTVGTAAYMSPEQCRGEINLTNKSDLYSLGVVMFELLTGHKPFVAESPVDMFMKHVNEPPPRPSRFVPDIPIWLDTLIIQLMEKEPKHRPLNADMVANALSEVLEKAAKGHSAGVDAVTARAVDRRIQSNVADETDREAARTLRSALGKKKIRKKSVPIIRRLWFVAIAAIFFLGAFAAVLWLVLRPPSAADLYGQAERKMVNPATYGEALADTYGRDGPIRKFLKIHPNDPKAEQIRKWEELAEVTLLDERLHKMTTAKGPLAPKPQTEFERKAVDAIKYDEFGDLIYAANYWANAKNRIDEADPKARFENKLADNRIAELTKKWKEEARSLPKFEKEDDLIRAYRMGFLRKKLDEVENLKKDRQFDDAKQLLKKIQDLYDGDTDPQVKELVRNPDKKPEPPPPPKPEENKK
jgi:eukaryotic-like serine/threonine-protein kinase